MCIYSKRNPVLCTGLTFICCTTKSTSASYSSLRICIGNEPLSLFCTASSSQSSMQWEGIWWYCGDKSYTFSDDRIRRMGRPCSQVNADQYLGCWLYVNSARTGADQTQPKASLSSKLSNHHFPSSRPRRLLSQGLCVCISATLFWAFMPHTISKPPLSSSPSLFLSFGAHQRDSNALCIMDGKEEKKKQCASHLYDTWNHRTGAIKVVK